MHLRSWSVTRHYWFITEEDVHDLAYMLASELYSTKSDPMPAFLYLGGEHGRGLLLAALAQPSHTFEGRFLYRTIFDKGAGLVVSMIDSHPFIDGNKRMGIATLSLFLWMNNYSILASNPETVQFALGIARGEIDQRQAASWLRKHIGKFTVEESLVVA